MQLLILLLCLGLAGCSTMRQSPSFDRAYSYLDQASDSATGKTAEAIKKAKEQIIAADKACSANTQALDDAVKNKNEAIKDAEVWKQKQRKALKELWIYRGAIIALVLWTFRGALFGGVMFVARKFVGVPW